MGFFIVRFQNQLIPWYGSVENNGIKPLAITPTRQYFILQYPFPRHARIYGYFEISAMILPAYKN
jgi:hypothetical protein